MSLASEPSAVPWRDPEWLVELAAWIDARLADAGTRRRSELVQISLRPRGALMSMETDRGRMWAKAVPPAFAHEVALTELLADIDPGIVPPVVAADRTLGRIVTEHVEGPALSSLDGEPAVWAATMSRLAEIQRVLANERDELASIGTVAAPIARLAANIPALLTDDDLLRVDRLGGLTGREATALRSRIPALVDACHLLESSRIPDSLDHGDLAADEVIVGEMGPVFLDWSDSSMTHPFLSAAALLSDRAGSRAVTDELATAYLRPWLSAGIGLNEETGRDALAEASIVLPLHRVALYAERILPSIEDPTEIAATVSGMLRAILPE